MQHWHVKPDALGYNDGTQITGGPLYKKILIVDDINDTGATFNWIAKDWQQSCQPTNARWTDVWGNNVRIATLTDNMASETVLPISYTCHEVNKAEEDVWLVYPWENVGVYDG